MRASRRSAPLRLASVLAAVVAGGWLAAAGATAQESAPKSPDAPPPQVGLDTLLKLPDSYGGVEERRGGATAEEWRSRYRQVRAELAAAEAALDESKAEMARLAGDSGNYQVSAPGAPAGETSPVSFKLREQIRSRREAVAERERALKSLEVEANLADVPPDWRE